MKLQIQVINFLLISMLFFSCGGAEIKTGDADTLADDGFNNIAFLLSEVDINKIPQIEAAGDILNETELSGARSNFEKSLEIDADNPAANFGMGIITLVEIIYDEELKNIFTSGTADDFLQKAGADIILPALEKSEGYLEKALDLDRTIEVVNGDTIIEIDRTEVYILSASINICKAGLNATLAYNISITLPEEPLVWGLDDLMGPLSILNDNLERDEFLTLKKDGGENLEKSRESLLKLIANIKGAYNYVSSETWSQENHLIKKEYFSFIDNFPGGIDLLSLMAEKILKYRFTLSYIGIPVTLNLPVFFNGGLTDLKDYLPYHRFNGQSFEFLNGPPEAPSSEIISEFPYFPDYSFGGIFEGMTRDEMINIFGMISAMTL